MTTKLPRDPDIECGNPKEPDKCFVEINRGYKCKKHWYQYVDKSQNSITIVVPLRE